MGPCMGVVGWMRHILGLEYRLLICIIHTAAPIPGPYMMSMPGSGMVERKLLGGRGGSEDRPAWRCCN